VSVASVDVGPAFAVFLVDETHRLVELHRANVDNKYQDDLIYLGNVVATDHNGTKHYLATKIAVLESLESFDAFVAPRMFLVLLPKLLPLETITHFEIIDMIETIETTQQLVQEMRRRMRKPRQLGESKPRP
jgi:hypothetical protein